MHAPDWTILDKLLRDYRTEYHTMLEKMSQSLEMAFLLEEETFALTTSYHHRHRKEYKLSSQIQNRIEKVSPLYEAQERFLHQFILRPFPTVMALPSPSRDDHTAAVPIHPENPQASCSPLMNQSTAIRSKTGMAHTNATTVLQNEAVSDPDKPSPSSDAGNNTAPASYDSALQILAHLVRDWSSWGAPVRANLYDWCRTALREHTTDTATISQDGGPNKLSVLVPGAGLGRLAWELAVRDGHVVQALEVSLGMAAATQFLFREPSTTESPANADEQQGQFTLYPYIHDGFQNQVHAEDRYEGVVVPDIPNLRVTTQEAYQHMNGSLSYTISSFEDLLLLSHMRSSQDAVVTCFFLDTATNLYQYLDILHYVLKSGAVWINVGPLQWHSNSLLPGVTVNELRQMLELDYDILHWSVDDEPMEYRNPTMLENHRGQDVHQERHRSSTAYSGYCPLRFAVRKKR